MKAATVLLAFAMLILPAMSVHAAEKCGGDNEHYLTCGPVQQPTCDNPSVENDLIGCAQGCFCKPDYIRHAEGGICVDINACPY
ncbi:chymotrypsin inhibitor-like isoform X1 [Anopheles merus]|uniref:TIL domain-containing protein n=1 Tax=Anopheles merus TaxID=30066 RepID=A0A2C9H5N1_ANOME|nr:chymotrypsin inhibitor-like isoform X1 [Anopheles merus]